MNMHNPPSNLDVALELARAGAFVFPCQSSGDTKKQPCRGVRWRAVSTCSEADIRRMWEQYPDAVPGIDLSKSGLLVIDCDRKLNDGREWLLRHAARHGDILDAVPTTDTPAGGRHHFYRNTFDPPHGNGRGQLPPKSECDIDIRGAGGFVIGPGAMFTDGTGAYVGHGSIVDAPVVPTWLADLLAPRVGTSRAFTPPLSQPVSDHRLASYGETALSALFSELASTPAGDRNNQANKIGFRAGQLVGGGCLSESAAVVALEQAALSWGLKPNDKALGPRGTIARAVKDGIASPRGPTDDGDEAAMVAMGAESARRLTQTVGGDLIDEETGEVVQERQDPPNFATGGGHAADWLHPPGLLGEITDWIVSTSRRPNRPLALAAAIVVVGTVCGRHISGPTRSGTHLYIACIGATGIGKDRPLKAVVQLLQAAKLPSLATSGKFMSSTAIENLLLDTPCCVATIDEMGQLFAKLSNKRASSHEASMGNLIRELWSNSFDVYSTSSKAQQKSIGIQAPALSLFGASTVDEFYNSLAGGSLDNGFLNRFLIVKAAPRSASLDDFGDPKAVPPSIAQKLRALLPKGSGDLSAGPMAFAPTSGFEYDPLPWADDAARLQFRELEESVLTRIDADPSLGAYISRSAEMSVRLATIRAAGIGGRFGTVSAADLEWGAALADASAMTMLTDIRHRMAENEQQAKHKMVATFIREAGTITRSKLAKKIDGRITPKDVDVIIGSLQEAQEIERLIITPEGSGRPATSYIWQK